MHKYIKLLLHLRGIKRKSLIIIYTISAFFLISVHLTAQVTVRVSNQSVKQALRSIENSSDYRFFYNNQLPDLDKSVSFEVNNQTIDATMNKMLEGLQLAYEKKDNNQIYLVSYRTKSQTSTSASPAPKKNTGTVVDETGEPVAGANVSIKGTSTGTITDIDGNFTIEAEAGQILIISFIGYIPKEITIGSQSAYKISLSEDSQAIEEVIVVGYGVMRKKLVTGATVQVKGDDLTKKNTATVLDALKGQTPGVNIQTVSTQPGDGFKVNIRGLGTTGNSSPLYIVDGVPVPSINGLNTSDIETVDVLKDASSAAIYGARASNGVILIGTKKGTVSKPTISYDGYYGMQNVAKKLNYVNAQDYLMLMSEFYTNNNAPIPDYAAQIQGYSDIVSGKWNGSNWLHETTNKNAPIQSHSINVSGGTEQSVYSVGLSAYSQEGIVGKPATPKFTRYTFQVNTETTIIKNKKFDILKIGENLNFSNIYRHVATNSNSGNQNSFASIMSGVPVIQVYNPDPTSPGLYPSYFPYDKYGGPTGIAPTAPNPLAYLEYGRSGNMSRSNALNGNVYLSIQPIKDLVFRSSFGINFNAESSRSYVPKYFLTATTTSSYYINSTDRTTQTLSNGTRWMFENTLTYLLDIKNHHFNFLLGTSVEKSGIGENISGSNGNSLFDSFDYAYLVNNKTIDPSYTTLTGSPLTPEKLLSGFGRITYDYNQTYMATVVLRADGSSNFAKGKQWGYFPSVSAGWTITNENFMESTKAWLNQLKIRASWGQNGNQSISPFQYLSTISFSNAYFYNYADKSKYTNGGFPNIIANHNVTWETSEQIDLGFDAYFLDSRLSTNLDWYKKRTVDWLIQAPILATDGTGAPYVNGGNVQNSGYELSLSWKDNVGDFNYSISPNVAFQTNEVTKINNPEGIIHGPSGTLHADQTEAYRAQVGYPIGYFWGLKTNGLFQNQSEIDSYKNAEGKVIQPSAKPGDIRYVDQNGDGAIDQDDKINLGDPNPNVIFGLSLDFTYKGFDFNAIANGVAGNQIMWNYFNNNNHGVYSWMDIALTRWHGEGTSNSYPRINIGSTQDVQLSDRFVANADYLRLTNLTIGYDFIRLWKNTPLKTARFYVSVQNLFTLTSYKGFNPEVGNSGPNSGNWAGGIDTSPYPLARTIMFGVSIKY
ncbi:SusC/RagA family TonB-linked outer membrane protein [Bacteroidia bacterium]|nr:SusC/RagA family TonB-linked outer membrane protein [Bacteroidia bacterium]